MMQIDFLDRTMWFAFGFSVGFFVAALICALCILGKLRQVADDKMIQAHESMICGESKRITPEYTANPAVSGVDE
jgi:hypothetical protein